MTMTSEAKHALAATIRSLRTRLLADLHDATESAYRLALPARDAGLDEAARARRGRLAAWLDEQVRAQGSAGAKGDRTAADFRREAEKQAAYTLLNRLVLLRLMEAPGPSGAPLREIPVVTGGWESHGYQTFRQLAPGIARGDETEGYAFLLRLVFEDLANELPGLYGPAGVADLFPVPAASAPARHRRPQRPGAGELLDRRHDARLGLPVLERPRARGARRQAQRRRQGRAARDRQQDADVHRAVHGGLAAPEQPGPDVAGHLPAARVDARGRRPTARSTGWRSGGPTGGRSARPARSRSPT